jgi:hypothetical protein
LNCASQGLGAYSLLPVSQRTLRLSLDGPRTEYRWYPARPCSWFKMFRCYDQEKIEIDFDFTKESDRKRFNELGFECSVRKKP